MVVRRTVQEPKPIGQGMGGENRGNNKHSPRLGLENMSPKTFRRPGPVREGTEIEGACDIDNE